MVVASEADHYEENPLSDLELRLGQSETSPPLLLQDITHPRDFVESFDILDAVA